MEPLDNELIKLYDIFSKKIEEIFTEKNDIELRSDPTLVRVLIESSMSIVERYKTWSGEKKKKQAIIMLIVIINDLAEKGKISREDADEINSNINFWGGIAMDIAVDAVKGAFDIGQDFTEDVIESGCKSACKQNCNIC